MIRHFNIKVFVNAYLFQVKTTKSNRLYYITLMDTNCLLLYFARLLNIVFIL